MLEFLKKTFDYIFKRNETKLCVFKMDKTALFIYQEGISLYK